MDLGSAGWCGPPSAASAPATQRQPAPPHQQQPQAGAPGWGAAAAPPAPGGWGVQPSAPSPYSNQHAAQPYPYQQHPQHQQPAQPYPYQQPPQHQQPAQPYAYQQPPQHQQPAQPYPYQQPPQHQQPAKPYPYQQPPQHQQPAQPYPYQHPPSNQQPTQPYPHQQRPPQQQQQQPQQQRPPAPTAHNNGRKKALLIGCCYPGTSAALSGCINDVQIVQYALQHRFGFPAASIMVLRDDTKDPGMMPTKANIIKGIRWLVSDQRPGDSLFFHFSGHGTQRQDFSGDESDGMDEAIMPTDHKRAGVIVDDDLNAALVKPLQQGVVLHALIDACHSGTAMDLAYRTKVDSSGRFYWKGKRSRQRGTRGGTCYQIGACKDRQVASDTNRLSGGAYTGAATYAFIDAVERYGTRQTYAQVLAHMQETLKRQGGAGGGGGIPGLSSIASMAGGGGGGLVGLAGGLLASFVLGPASMGGQTPVMCCDKPVDLTSATLAI